MNDQTTELDEKPRAQLAEVQTLNAALAALNRTTNIVGQVADWGQPRIRNRLQPDARIVLVNNGKQYHYTVEIKNTDRFAALGAIKAQIAAHNKELGVLVAPYITVELADRCRQIGLQFIDTAGNAYLNAPGMYVFVTGQKHNTKATAGTVRRANTATGMRVVFVLLCKPELLNAPYRAINEAAGVALGAVGWVIFDLVARGYLLRDERKGQRRFANPRRLVNEWVINYPTKLRPKLTRGTFRAPNTDWWRKTDIEKYGGRWGGEIAGRALAKHREPGAVTIYMKGDLKRLILDKHLRADPNGDVEILDAFWQFDQVTPTLAPNVVPPLLAYADLMATLDPRNHETGKIIYEEYIENAFGQI